MIFTTYIVPKKSKHFCSSRITGYVTQNHNQKSPLTHPFYFWLFEMKLMFHLKHFFFHMYRLKRKIKKDFQPTFWHHVIRAFLEPFFSLFIFSTIVFQIKAVLWSKFFGYVDIYKTWPTKGVFLGALCTFRAFINFEG